jgi:hypothetical protein
VANQIEYTGTDIRDLTDALTVVARKIGLASDRRIASQHE